jgi:hypothetical protein
MAPFRWIPCQAKRPDSRNISDMKKVSLKPTIRVELIERCASTIGNAAHHRGSATSDAAGGGANG